MRLMCAYQPDFTVSWYCRVVQLASAGSGQSQTPHLYVIQLCGSKPVNPPLQVLHGIIIALLLTTKLGRSAKCPCKRIKNFEVNPHSSRITMSRTVGALRVALTGHRYTETASPMRYAWNAMIYSILSNATTVGNVCVGTWCSFPFPPPLHYYALLAKLRNCSAMNIIIGR